MPALVLVVEDEEDLAATLEFNLKREGHATRVANTGEAALRAAAEDPVPDVILLDLMLPDVSGTETCRRLKQEARTRDVPIIMLTAKGEEIDRVIGLEVGADDYVVKPFSVRELMLRVRAVLRRTHPNEAPHAANGERRFADLRVDPEAHRAWVGTFEITLTALEFKLLTTLLDRKGRVQTREQLLEEVWQMPSELTTRTVDTHVKRLRQKLGHAGDYIETVRGVGYRFLDRPRELA
ncbi:MAG TPA: response regulator transcription factor [Polyangiales bacterium]|nr:response regulator transcription factor [Polyangiales bacterium]